MVGRAIGCGEVDCGNAGCLGPRRVPGEAGSADAIDAVIVDGDAFRASHGGYQAVVRYGLTRHCTWRNAYPAIRKSLRKEKAALLRSAMRRRLNLVIPHTCQQLSDCWDTMEMLQGHGYVNHVVLVLGHPRAIRLRGLRRARATGKRYAPQEWQRSVDGGLGLVARATGLAELVWTTPRQRWLVRAGRPADVLHAVAALGINPAEPAAVERVAVALAAA